MNLSQIVVNDGHFAKHLIGNQYPICILPRILATCRKVRKVWKARKAKKVKNEIYNSA
jgi:hypothetical protein